MHLALHKLEQAVDKIIPPLLAALIIVIIGEFFFTSQLTFYRTYADWLELLVILIFATDLGFKYSRVRKLPEFVKKYWPEIIATIPFFLMFRLLESIGAFKEGAVATGHIAQEARIIVEEAERTREVTRTAKMMGALRTLSRFPRLLKVAPFYEKPTGKHHWHENKKALQ